MDKSYSKQSIVDRAEAEYRACCVSHPQLLYELEICRSAFETPQEFRAWLDYLARGIELHRN